MHAWGNHRNYCRLQSANATLTVDILDENKRAHATVRRRLYLATGMRESIPYKGEGLDPIKEATSQVGSLVPWLQLYSEDTPNEN